MKTSYIVGGIVVLLLLILFSVKYVISDKYTLREILNAKDVETVTKNELPKQNGTFQNFTYSIWLYINDWNYNYGISKPIFGKFQKSDGITDDNYNNYIDNLDICCDSALGQTGISCEDYSPKPVVSFAKKENQIFIYFPCDNNLSNDGHYIFRCDVGNIPIQKWINLSMTLYKKTLDVYINGKLHKTCVLPGIPIMTDLANSNGDILLTPGGGFDGYTSKFQFYPEALNPQEIWNIYSNGYGSLASSFGDYRVKMSLIENGNETNSLTI